MKSKCPNYKILIFTTIFILICCKINSYGQDTLNPQKALNDARLQLLEYNQKIVEAKMELLEIKMTHKDFGLKKTKESPLQLISNSITVTQKDTMNINPFTQAITISFNRIFEGTMQLSYEKAIKNDLSLDVSLMGTYVTKDGFGKGYLQNQDLAYADEATNSYIYYSGNMIRSIGGIVRLKNYLLTRVNSDSKAPLGLYAAPQLMYRRVWITGNQYIYDYYMGTQKEITRNLDVIQGGVILGSKFAVAKVLCLDVYIGGVMRLSKYYNEPTFTKYKRWNNIDYSGILPTAGINIGILK